MGEHYKCGVCGNQTVVVEVGGGELVCCGEPMALIDVWNLGSGEGEKIKMAKKKNQKTK